MTTPANSISNQYQIYQASRLTEQICEINGWWLEAVRYSREGVYAKYRAWILQLLTHKYQLKLDLAFQGVSPGIHDRPSRFMKMWFNDCLHMQRFRDDYNAFQNYTLPILQKSDRT